MFCYDKPIPEEIIDEPVGLSISEKEIGGNKRCTCCEAKGALLCATCSGTGLYVDSIMESQGIIVKVRCLGKALNLVFFFNSSYIIIGLCNFLSFKYVSEPLLLILL